MKRCALVAALALVGCSGAPSEQELRTALVQSGGKGAAQAVLLACQRSPDRPGFVCDYRAPACNRFTGTCAGERPYTGRFLHAGGKWQLIEDLTPRAAPDPVTQPLAGIALPPPLPSPTATAPASAIASSMPELSDDERRLVARWRAFDTRCDDGGDYAQDACDARDELGAQLERRQLCYGPPGGYGYDRAWRPCAPAGGQDEDQR